MGQIPDGFLLVGVDTRYTTYSSNIFFVFGLLGRIHTCSTLATSSSTSMYV